jgi:hypothetical protein
MYTKSSYHFEVRIMRKCIHEYITGEAIFTSITVTVVGHRWQLLEIITGDNLKKFQV